MLKKIGRNFSANLEKPLSFCSPSFLLDVVILFSVLVANVCELLGSDAQSLKQCLCLRRITTGSTGEQFLKPCSASECVERRDCMVKLIYSR